MNKNLIDCMGFIAGTEDIGSMHYSHKVLTPADLCLLQELRPKY